MAPDFENLRVLPGFLPRNCVTFWNGRTCRTRLPILRGKERPAPQGLPGPAVAPVRKTLYLDSQGSAKQLQLLTCASKNLNGTTESQTNLFNSQVIWDVVGISVGYKSLIQIFAFNCIGYTFHIPKAARSQPPRGLVQVG